MHIIIRLSFLFLCTASSALAAIQVGSTLQYREPGYHRTIYAGDLSLPADGYWRIQDMQEEATLQEVYLVLSETARKAIVSQRNEKDIVEEARAILVRYWKPIVESAAANGNIAPDSIEDLDQKKYAQLLDAIERSWRHATDASVAGPFVFLIPGVQFIPDPRTGQIPSRNPGARQVLLIELQPYLDDGKHWVLYTDGSCVRAQIDPQLAARHGLLIQPQQRNAHPNAQAEPTLTEYTLITLLEEPVASRLNLRLVNAITGEKRDVSWDISRAEPADRKPLQELQRARWYEWLPYMSAAPAGPALNTWLKNTDEQRYKASFQSETVQRQPARQLSVFGFLGGRAAIEETLQMQDIVPAGDHAAGQAVPVNSIAGVQVQSHPFATMLAGKEGGRLPLADLVPHDHFFVYTAQPAALIPFLDDGAGFLARLGGVMQSNNIRYDLRDRYLARLGFDRKWLQLFLDSGVVRETALIFPDLYFIDGTDVTAVAKLNSTGLIGSLVKLVGVRDLSDNNIVTHALPGNRQAFWALRDDILIISTNRAELDAVLALQASDGQNSLGRSAEFRYMLTQLEPGARTRLFAYLSDPFIRKQVGPAVKISQRRRLLARRDLEVLSSAALLARLDGLDDPLSPASLADRGYIPRYLDNGDYSLNTDFQAISITYGAIPALKTLNEVPVAEASAAEAASYTGYVDNYNRYWRRYFDPIAIRIDNPGDGSLETEIFILPLVDNTIYAALRDILSAGEDKSVLRVPDPDPKPVTMLSLNLRDKLWRELAKEYLGTMNRYTYLNPALLDDLGPGMHLAIHDGDPVIALGSGDILGAFSADTIGNLGRGSTMFIPMAMSILTRPCSLYIETGNPENTRRFLRQASSLIASRPGIRREVDIDFYQIEDRDEWIYTFTVFGLVKLRYGIEIQGNYLVIRNIPWAHKEVIAATVTAPFNGAMLQAFPASCKTQLPGLYTTAEEHNRKAARQGMAYLYPIVASGLADIDEAPEHHYRLYGFRPAHPGNGRWFWLHRQITSSIYGSAREQKQMSYRKEAPEFGLFRDIASLSLNMQFEDTGLRSLIRWRTREVQP